MSYYWKGNSDKSHSKQKVPIEKKVNYYLAQRARKFKKVQAIKLVKLNTKSIFFREIAFLAVLKTFSQFKN